MNLVLLPLWTIVDGRRRDMRIPWIFFVMSLFTSLAFSMALYLAFVERQIRYTPGPGSGPTRWRSAVGRLNHLRPAHVSPVKAMTEGVDHPLVGGGQRRRWPSTAEPLGQVHGGAADGRRPVGARGVADQHRGPDLDHEGDRPGRWPSRRRHPAGWTRWWPAAPVRDRRRSGGCRPPRRAPRPVRYRGAGRCPARGSTSPTVRAGRRPTGPGDPAVPRPPPPTRRRPAPPGHGRWRRWRTRNCRAVRRSASGGAASTSWAGVAAGSNPVRYRVGFPSRPAVNEAAQKTLVVTRWLTTSLVDHPAHRVGAAHWSRRRRSPGSSARRRRWRRSGAPVSPPGSNRRTGGPS